MLAPAGLTWLDLSYGFPVLPPVLADATAMRGLELVGCPNLALTMHDVDSILLRMPHLRTLAIDVSTTPPRVLRALQRSLPGLVITQEWSHSHLMPEPGYQPELYEDWEEESDIE